jgi:hypothetical protein
MAQLQSTPAPPKALDLFVAENASEQAFQNGKPDRAIEVFQELLDKQKITGHEKGWYLREMARYAHAFDKTCSNELQISAHKLNRYLLKPRAGMVIEPISATGQKRIARLITWGEQFQTPEDLLLDIDTITAQIRFGVSADDFEAALNDLGMALGFVTQRPDKEWREGPDNLWALRDNHYLLRELSVSLRIRDRASQEPRATSAAAAHKASGIGNRPWCPFRQASKRRQTPRMPTGISSGVSVAIAGPPGPCRGTTDVTNYGQTESCRLTESSPYF